MILSRLQTHKDAELLERDQGGSMMLPGKGYDSKIPVQCEQSFVLRLNASHSY